MKIIKIFCLSFLVLSCIYAKDTVNMTYVKSPLNVPSIVDKEKGFYSKGFGKDVKYFEITSGAKQTQALASGSLDILNCVGGTSVILAASNGADIKIISAYSRAPKAFQIFTNNDSIKNAKDLKGKKIAGPKGTILHELLVRYLAKENLTINDVEFVSMGIPAAYAALENKSIDAALLAGPIAYNANKAGLKLLTTGESLITPVILTATSGKFYKENKEFVDKFRKTQNEILNYINSNEKEALSFTAKATGLSNEAVKDMYGFYDFNPKLSKEDIKALELTQEFMYQNKMIDKKIDISNLVIKSLY